MGSERIPCDLSKFLIMLRVWLLGVSQEAGPWPAGRPWAAGVLPAPVLRLVLRKHVEQRVSELKYYSICLLS